jgi:hypothetical protein
MTRAAIRNPVRSARRIKGRSQSRSFRANQTGWRQKQKPQQFPPEAAIAAPR